MNTTTPTPMARTPRASQTVVTRSGLPPVLVGAIRRALAPDEEVMWLAQPVPARIARLHIWWALFGGAGTAFAAWWTAMCLRDGEDWAIVGLVFLILFGVKAAGPFVAFRAARRSVYLVTDRRALVISTGELGRQPWPTNTLTVSSYTPDELRHLARVDVDDDGGGDLIFRQTEEEGYEHTSVVTEGFLGVADARAARRALAALCG
jgi:hypothetical protein